MKKNFLKLFAMMILAVSISSCGDEPTPAINTEIDLSTDDMDIEAATGEFIIDLTSSTAWKASDIPEWVTLTPSEGKGNASIKVTFTANDTTDEREAKITITAGTGDDIETETLTITQEGKEEIDTELDLSIDNKEIDAEAGEFTIDLTTNAAWKASGIPDWMTLTPNEGKGNASIKVTYTRNETANGRGVNITFIAGEGTNIEVETLTITQSTDKLIAFEDPAFKAALVNPQLPDHWPKEWDEDYTIDTNGDGEISMHEAAEATHIYVSGSHESPGAIKTMPELQHFTALEQLQCSYNSLTTLDLSKNTELELLFCNNNTLATLDLSNNTELEDLVCFDNTLATLDLSKNTELEYLACFDNALAALDLSKNTELERLACNGNTIATLDLSKNTEIEWLYCHDNTLATLDVTMLTNLKPHMLFCGDQKADKTITLTMTATQKALPVLGDFDNERITIVTK